MIVGGGGLFCAAGENFEGMHLGSSWGACTWGQSWRLFCAAGEKFEGMHLGSKSKGHALGVDLGIRGFLTI